MHAGLDKSHRVAVLDKGVQFKPISMENEAAHFLQTRKFQRQEIASWFIFLRISWVMRLVLVSLRWSRRTRVTLQSTLEPWLLAYELRLGISC